MGIDCPASAAMAVLLVPRFSRGVDHVCHTSSVSSSFILPFSICALFPAQIDENGALPQMAQAAAAPQQQFQQAASPFPWRR